MARLWGVAMNQVLILGGGASGLAAAVELSRRGLPSTVVESDPSLGGMASQLSCKGSPSCQHCDACHPYDLRREALLNPLINLITAAEVGYVGRNREGFRATIRSPEGCEDYDFRGVIIAVGAMPYDPGKDARLRYRECPNVLSSLEVERSLAETNALTVPSTGRVPESMAIIQCVGSRDAQRGMPYCSKACCKYASKIGRRLRHLYPDLRLTFFFMDWRPMDRSEPTPEEWAAEDELVRAVRSRPSEILEGDRPTVRYATPADSVVEESFDVVMLSVGLVPRPDTPRLAVAFGLEVDAQGYLRSDLEDVIVAGTCGGPKDLRESMEEGTTAGGRMAALLEARP
ncbi:MAG: NAD(P)-binding protein [Methanomassiliicoccus sp.]|nr:NAD(P)-binding protein [Methanomassiliicoccus sp.]